MRGLSITLAVALCASCGSAPRPVIAPLQTTIPPQSTPTSCDNANTTLDQIAKLAQASGSTPVNILGDANAPSAAPANALDATKTYSLMAHVPSSVPSGSEITIQVAGTSIDPLDPNNATLTKVTVQGCGSTLNVPLGNWPLRAGFAVTASIGTTPLAFDVAQLVVSGNRPRIGVNATDIAWDPNAQQTMSKIIESGVREVRMNIRGTDLLDTTLQLVEQANNGHVPVLMIISGAATDWNTTYPSPYDPSQFQTTCGFAEAPIQPISQVDVSLFSARVSAYVQALAANHVQVAGFELGNEWDWSCFNTDFPMTGDANAATLAAFLTKYTALLQATQAIVNAAYPEGQRPPVGLFGMANANPAVSQDILKGLTSVGGQNVLSTVDFVGQHFYGTLDNDQQILEQTWELSGKPTWVTEWGVTAQAGWERYAAMESFMEMLSENVAYQPQVALVFDWYSLFYNESTDTVMSPESDIFTTLP